MNTPKEGNKVIQARICPIEDGTCPTTVLGLNEKSQAGHCQYDAHYIRAKYTMCNCEHIRNLHTDTESTGAEKCLECSCQAFQLKEIK